jgi:hypothetical protein
MPRIINIELLSWNELTEEQKQKAVEYYREKNYEHLFDQNDAEMMKEGFEEQLVESGYPKEIEVYYSLSYCQGDGVCCELKNQTMYWSEISTIAKRLMKEQEFNKLNSLVEKYDMEVLCTIKHNSNHYYHMNTMEIVVTYVENDEMSPETDQEFNNLIEQLQSLVSSDLRGFCHKFEESGYKQIEYLQSDEYLKEYLSEAEKEYELNDNGSIHKIWG